MTTPDMPLLYKRKYTDGDEVSFSDLQEAYRMAANLVAKGGDDYLPIFERLDKEMQERQYKETMKARALEVAKHFSKNNPTNSV